VRYLTTVEGFCDVGLEVAEGLDGVAMLHGVGVHARLPHFST
jgi:hypothetical protein